MQRVPFPDEQKLEPQVRKTLESLPLNVVRMSANGSPQVFEAFGRMGGAVAGKVAFSHQVREAVILRVAHISRSEYELHHHVSIALSLGVSEEAINAIARQDYAALEPGMAAAAKFADEVVPTGNCSDAVLSEVRRHYGERGVIDLLFLIGLYMAVARVIAVTGIELDNVPLKKLSEG